MASETVLIEDSGPESELAHEGADITKPLGLDDSIAIVKAIEALWLDAAFVPRRS